MAARKNLIMYGQVANRVASPEGDVLVTVTANPDDSRNAFWGVPERNGEGPRIWLTVSADAAELEALQVDTPVTITVAGLDAS